MGKKNEGKIAEQGVGRDEEKEEREGKEVGKKNDQ